MKITILALSFLASIAHGDGIPLFPAKAFERRWYPDPGAVSFGFPDSPHSFSPTYRERAASEYHTTRLVVLPSAPPLLSESPYAFTLLRFTPALLTWRPILALAYEGPYEYDGEPELFGSSIYLTTQTVFSQQTQ